MSGHSTNPNPNTPSGVSSDTPPHRYTAALADQIEQRWQSHWEAQQTFRVPNPGEPGFNAKRPKFYCLDMFPYPSGAGLHVGHPEGYTATDILCRYKRMCGFNVLHPMGYDAFGLPAEQYAIQTGVHPAITTKKSIETFRRQLKRFGFCYDWSREYATIDPAYYRWTQWIFLQLYNAWVDPRDAKARPIADLVSRLESGELGVRPDETAAASGATTRTWSSLDTDAKRRVIDNHRLAYVGETTVNWCPALGTVLANDEVIDGRSERGGHPVLRKPLRQWMFRITSLAQRLLDDLRPLDWPESTKAQQADWIGRSEGAEIDFPVEMKPAGQIALRVFTTRPDTLFGATYMVVAPEHPIVDRVLAAPGPRTNADKVREYANAARNRSDIERMESKDKTGVDLGVDAINPATGEHIPVWVADYVLMGYGTGAIMAVPAHDQRDFEFAQAFNLPIRDVVYNRAIMAMRFFTTHAHPDDRVDEQWAGVLADLLGMTATKPDADFDHCLALARSRRLTSSDAGTAVSIGQDLAVTDTPGAVGERRGVTSIIWLDALGELKIKNFDDLASRFARAEFHKESGGAFDAAGHLVNSANTEVSLDGLGIDEAKQRILDWLERTGRGTRKINFKLRDWTFSRQRYWGEPFPIVFDDKGNHHAVSADSLPVQLPDLSDYRPVVSDDPSPLLERAGAWARTTAADAGVAPVPGLPALAPNTPVKRETNTMPGSAGSSWYFLRYCDAHNESRFVGEAAERYWMKPPREGALGGVDFYMGGNEHAVGHLLYARFWHKVLFDLGHVGTPEPFQRLFHQGLITAYSFQRADKTLCPNDEVEEIAEGRFIEKATGAALTPVVAKMSKSLKNVVNPDEIIAQFGADTFRLYEMYMGPLEASKPWNTRDMVGLFRFLQRVWRNMIDEQTGRCLASDAAPDTPTLKLLHRTIAGVRKDIEGISFNTAIAKLIEFNNHLAGVVQGSGAIPRSIAEPLTLLLAPFAPHLAEELWQRLGHARTLADEPFPVADESLTVDQEVEIAVQVLGKVRGKMIVPAAADPKAVEHLVLNDPKVQDYLGGKPVKKVIVVPGRLVNIVV